MGLADVQKQMIMLIRTSVMLCQTLSPLPDEVLCFWYALAAVVPTIMPLASTSTTLLYTYTQRYLFMKLLYHDHAPLEYEPPFFRPAPDAPAHFISTPLQLYVMFWDAVVYTPVWVPFSLLPTTPHTNRVLGSVETPHTAAHVAVTSVCDRVISAARTNSVDVNCTLAENLVRELSYSRQVYLVLYMDITHYVINTAMQTQQFTLPNPGC